MSDGSQALQPSAQADLKAAEELLPLVYEELRKLAAHKMANEAVGHTLQSTALVHEAWMRLVGKDGQAHFANRAHFFAAAAEAMRRILIDRARKRDVRRVAGLATPEELHASRIELHVPTDELLAVHEALDGLAAVDASAAQLVKLRYFVGMTLAEAAESLGLSLRSAERLWTFSRAWLREALGKAL